MNERAKIKNIAETAVILANEAGVFLSVCPFVLWGATVDHRVETLSARAIQNKDGDKAIAKFCEGLRSDAMGEANLYTACALFHFVTFLCSRPGAPRFTGSVSSEKGIQRFLDRNSTTTKNHQAA